MLHHYMQRGHTLDYLLNLGESEKLFYQASLLLYEDEETKRWAVK
jgi:hypothetical protein